MNDLLPAGFRATGLHCGIKSSASKHDLSLVVSDRDAVGVGVYTRNIVYGAPVRLNRERTPSDRIRAIVVNSGVANACTGDQGYRDAQAMAAAVAQECGFAAEQVLVMSTGVIGTLLPLEKITTGIQRAVAQLDATEDALIAAAQGMMTTDTHHKVRSRLVEMEHGTVHVTALAKGAAMIGPNMATMLAIILTDARIDMSMALEGLRDAANESFNCISVEGHMSTSDTVLLLANGAAGGPVLSGRDLARFQATLVEVCEDLAQSIPADGEGASHLITVEVHGADSHQSARTIAKTVADSPLVKTAIAGNDPNWGRIVSAAGYAGVDFDPDKVSLHLNGFLLYERGVPVAFDSDAVSADMGSNRNVGIVLLLDEGTHSARFWTSDLTAEYVRLNADYHT
jgi:glutamate N-acetyltransferase/amino-acid N-acetyltransferase